jgi:hypothetical protein
MYSSRLINGEREAVTVARDVSGCWGIAMFTSRSSLFVVASLANVIYEIPVTNASLFPISVTDNNANTVSSKVVDDDMMMMIMMMMIMMMIVACAVGILREFYSWNGSHQ